MMLRSTLRRRWALGVVAIAGPIVEVTLIAGLAPSVSRALAPQATALAPFGVFHDLRWVLVYHASWLLLALELVATVALRGALIAFFVREAWPEDVPRPSFPRALARGSAFTIIAMILLTPFALMLFAQAVVPLSWFFFAAVPPVVLIAAAIHHAPVESWARRRPTLRTMGWIGLSFVAMTIAGGLLSASTLPTAIVVGAGAGAFNAIAWRRTVHALLGRAPVRRRALVPVLVSLTLAIVVAGSAIGFATKEPPGITVTVPEDEDAATGRPVLVVKGFGSTYSGNVTYDLGPGTVVRRFSYAGLDEQQRPKPYRPADTQASLRILGARMHDQVLALRRRMGTDVTIVAESEGGLVAENYLATHDAPVNLVILLSPITTGSVVYYPERGRRGWGIAAGYGLRGIAAFVNAISNNDYSADAALIRDLVDLGPSPAASLPCGTSHVAFVPLADAVAAHATEGRVLTVTAFHGGLLGDPEVLDQIRQLLAGGRPSSRSSAWERLDDAIFAGATAWHVPALVPTLNDAWQVSPSRPCR